MTDPYQVLGVSRDAGLDDIKKAYRNLSRKYHPDANINNPNKAQAEERFKQVQQAYQQIVYEKEHGTSSGYGQNAYGSSGYGQSTYSRGYGYGNTGYQNSYDDFFGGYYRQRQQASYGMDPKLQAALNYINSGHNAEALNVLNGMSERTAAWYYLHAIANSRMGNNVNAREDARKAYQMEPGNTQYRQLYEALESGNTRYASQGAGYGYDACGSGETNVSPCMSCAPCLCCMPGFCCC